MTMKKVLITSKSFNKQSKYIDKLKNFGLDVITTVPKTEDEYLSLIDDDVIGIIVGTEKITANIIGKAKNLQVISRFGTGIDNICINETDKRNIPVFMTSTEPKEAVAELTLALMLIMIRNLYKDKPSVGNNLEGKTIGIIGYGNIGIRVKELLEPFNCNIITFDIKTDSWDIYDKLFEISDIITIHTPLNAESFHMIDWCGIETMKKTPYIINTSRAEIIDEDAIKSALKNNKIRGFASDVNKIENFKEFDNVYILPHIGSATEESRDLMEKKAIDYILEGLKC